MKRNCLRSVLPCLLLACGFISCSDDDNPAPATILVKPAEGLVFEAEGGTQRLIVEAQGAEWTAQKSDAWITLSSDASANRIDVTVGPCDNTQGRNGEITVLGGGAEPVVVKITQKGVVPTLTVSPTQLDFDDPDAAYKIIEVTASHVEWQIEEPAQKWIGAEADREAGTIRVSVEENPDNAPRNGSFRITGEGVEPIVVNVTQPQHIDFWSRSIAYRMGYRGKVKSVGRHIDLINNDGELELYDLQFDIHGNLTQFTREADAMTVTLAYDAQNRITEIAAKAAEYDFSFLLEYDAHGKYIPTFELFEYDLDEMFPVDFRVWMPFLIKDLAAVNVRDRLIPENNLDYRFAVTGDKASVDAYDPATGEVWYPEYYTIDFAGNYPSRLDSEGEEYATYQIDAASGKIVGQTMASYYDILFERSLDRRNTISRAVYGNFDIRASYNEQLDIASRTVVPDDEMASLTATYLYDETGNWTEVTLNSTVQAPITASRKITYWE